jgi:hypothetical protein
MFETIVKIIRLLKSQALEVPVSLPNHLYIPDGAESIDIAQICEVAKSTGATEEPFKMITLAPEKGEEYYLLNYGLYTDAELGSDIEFYLKINGKKALRLHGRPDSATDPTKYTLDYGLSPDLSNNGLKNCQIILTPNDVFTVEAINRNEDLAIPMGVRLVGYVLNSNAKSTKLIR